MANNIDEFNLAAITRDLARRPEIKHLARVLQKLAATSPVGNEEPAPIFIMQAYKLIERPEMAIVLVETINICKKDR